MHARTSTERVVEAGSGELAYVARAEAEEPGKRAQHARVGER